MNKNEANVKILVTEGALRLNEILNILNMLRCSLKPDYGIEVDDEKLVDIFRDIPKMSEYIELNELEFAKSMLALIDIKGEKVDEALEEIFSEEEECDYEEKGVLYIPTGESYTTPECENGVFAPRIVDFEEFEGYNAYAGFNTIAYDFIAKMQPKLWNDILDWYLDIDLSDAHARDLISLHCVFEYDKEFIDSINMDALRSNSVFKRNLRNWGKVTGIFIVDDDVDVIFDYDNDLVIVSIDFNI